jgi:hypothetical protein
MTTHNTDRIVWIHGIGRQRAGYSLPWRQAFNPLLNFEENQYREALWGPIFTAETIFSATLDSPSLLQSSTPLNPAELVKANELLRSLTNTIQARKSAQQKPGFTGGWPGGVVNNVSEIGKNLTGIASGTVSNVGGMASSAGTMLASKIGQPDRASSHSGTRTQPATPDAAAMLSMPQDTVGEFVEYLVSPKVRTQVKEKLKEHLRQLADGNTINTIIAHSWGTVVAYESLIDLEKETPAFRLKHLFTFGSPLWLVQLLLDERSGRKPKNVEQWINVTAQGDPIGCWLKPGFEVDGDFAVSNYGNQVNAHSSYFLPNNSEVQRDIVAKAILQQ